MDKILCDQMLGSLAKWLRILGIDTYFAQNNVDDDELLRIALAEKRILITRDKELLRRAAKQNISTIPIQSTDLTEQLRSVIKQITIDNKRFFSRCTICNALIKTVDKSTVRPFVPKKVYATNDLFWYCHVCDKYYWQGSHYEKIQKTLSDIIDNKTM